MALALGLVLEEKRNCALTYTQKKKEKERGRNAHVSRLECVRLARLVGKEISPQMVRFCQTQVWHVHPGTIVFSEKSSACNAQSFFSFLTQSSAAARCLDSADKLCENPAPVVKKLSSPEKLGAALIFFIVSNAWLIVKCTTLK